MLRPRGPPAPQAHGLQQLKKAPESLRHLPPRRLRRGEAPSSARGRADLLRPIPPTATKRRRPESLEMADGLCTLGGKRGGPETVCGAKPPLALRCSAAAPARRPRVAGRRLGTRARTINNRHRTKRTVRYQISTRCILRMYPGDAEFHFPSASNSARDGGLRHLDVVTPRNPEGRGWIFRRVW